MTTRGAAPPRSPSRYPAGMATVLFAPVTFNLAETTRAIEIARAIGGRHRCVFQAYEPDYVPLIERAGFEVHRLAPVLSSKGRAALLAVDQVRPARNPLTARRIGQRVDAERTLIRDTRAEVVVHGTNPTSVISARAEGVPLVYPVPFALTRPHVRQTARLGLVPGRSAVARAADLAASAVFRELYTRAPILPPGFAKVAREHGVAPPGAAVALVEGDWNLLTVLPSELAGYDLPENFRRVGPIFARLDGEVPPIVRELAAGPRPLVYFALGSSGSRRLALDVVRALGDVDAEVVAPIRHYLEPGDERALPRNVHLVDLLPAHRLGGLVDAAVLHGGQGTVQTACATGVPFIGIGLQPEQTWNVAVCERAGNAIALRPRDARTPRLAAAVERALRDPVMRAAAERMRASAEGADGAGAVASFLDDLLASRHAHGRPGRGPARTRRHPGRRP